jgi:phytoene synthase
LDTIRYPDIATLLAYCYKVASVVGLVSARIFGAQGTSCDDYAVKLGYAFQLTNIMRDVGQDARETGRIYLPQDELARFGVTEAAILKGEREPGFTALMEHQHARAQRYYDEARRSLPPAERGHMIAARMMDAIYSRILTQMKSTDFQTLHRRERLSKGTKAIILARFLAEGWSRRILVGQR